MHVSAVFFLFLLVSFLVFSLVNPSGPILVQDLADDLSSELSSNFRSVVLGLLMLAPVYDASELRNAMKVRVSHLLLLLLPLPSNTK